MWGGRNARIGMRKWVQKVVKTKKFFVVAAALAVAMQPLYGVFTAPAASAASQVVTGNTSTWLFNRDTSTSTPYHFTTAKAKTGYGSLYVEPIGAVDPKDKFVAEYFDKTSIDQLKTISYDFMVAGTGTAASANQFYLNIYATIDNSDEYFDCRFDYVPSVGSTSSFSKAKFHATDIPTAVTKRNNRIDICPPTLAEMPEGSHMRAFAINVGDTGTSDAGLAGYLDNVVVNKKGAGAEKYDFERALPQVSYVLPTSANQTFRPSDNPVRVKIDDSQQAERVRFSLWSYNTATGSFGSHIKNVTVQRENCDLRAAGNYILCDIKSANGWTPLSEGTYAVKLTTFSSGEAVIRAKMNEYWSHPFTVDTARPTVDSFVLENPTSGYANTSVTVAATASDNSAVESVNFYMTTPREDGVCTGNGPKLTEERVWAADGGKYRTTLNTAALVDGEYCITAASRDHAKNNSALQHMKVIVDHTAPTLLITTPDENAVFGGDDQIIVTSQLEDTWGLGNYFIDINSANVTILSDPETVEVLPEADVSEVTSVESTSLTVIAIYNAADFANGEYVITVRVTDKAGNVTEENRTIFIDHSVPPMPGRGVTTPPTEEEADQAEDELAQLTQRLTQPFSVPRSFANSTGGDQVSQQVLGANEGDNKEVASGERTLAAVPSSEGWKIFGIAWYWWLLLAAVLGVATAWIMRRRNSGEA